MKEENAARKEPAKGGSGGARAAPRITVLHVDDDPNDTELLRAATRKADLSFTIHNVEDGEKAMAYLNGVGPYVDRERYPVPDLILLDLKLPRATGFEILSYVRSHPHLKSVPVVIFSGSELQADMDRAYEIGASSYVVKPIGFEALVQVVKDISAWI